jgi:hypothetical protein
MAIEFEFRGEWYRVDTPPEVVALKKYLKARTQECESPPSDSHASLPAYGKWTDDRFLLLMEKIGYFEKKFLAALLSVSEPVDANTVVRLLSLPGGEKKMWRKSRKADGLLYLAGIQSGVVRHVRALGLEPFDLYQVHISWKGGQRIRYFTLDAGFRFAAAEQGWPPKFIREVLKT